MPIPAGSTGMPYRSEAQRRWAHTKEGMEALGGPEAVAKWDEETKGKDLPVKAGGKKDGGSEEKGKGSKEKDGKEKKKGLTLAEALAEAKKREGRGGKD